MNIKITDYSLVKLLNEVPKEVGDTFNVKLITQLFNELTEEGKAELVCLLTAFMTSRVNILTTKDLAVLK